MKTAESFQEILQAQITNTQVFPSANNKMELPTGIEPKNLSYLLGTLNPKLNLNKNQRRTLPKDYQDCQKTRSQETKISSQKETSPKVEVQAKPRLAEERKAGPAHKLSSLQHSSLSFFNNRHMNLLADFTATELKQAYRLLALKLHPDRTKGSTELFIELKMHYETLKKLVY